MLSLLKQSPPGDPVPLKTFYLIDGHAQIFRAYYAPFGAQLNAPDGEPTKATYIFTQMILGILEKQSTRPTAMPRRKISVPRSGESRSCWGS